MKRVHLLVILCFLINYFLFLGPALNDIKFYEEELLRLSSLDIKRPTIKEKKRTMGDFEFVETVDSVILSEDLTVISKEYLKDKDNNLHMMRCVFEGNLKKTEMLFNKFIEVDGLIFQSVKVENVEGIMVTEFMLVGRAL